MCARKRRRDILQKGHLAEGVSLQKAQPAKGSSWRRVSLQKAHPGEGSACQRLSLQKVSLQKVSL
jgi:hypothetical protein